MKSTRLSLAISSAIVALQITGCSGASEPGIPAAPSSEAPRTSMPSPSTVTGYRHLYSSSRFVTGTGGHTVLEGTRTKMIGAEGVFSVHANGAVFAIPNAGSAAGKARPWSGTGAEHDARVVAYFTAAGLPAEQMGEVLTNTLLEGGGPAVDPTPPPAFKGFDSKITRTVDGVRVVDSAAHAQFNADGDVVAEGVYWPELPQNVVDDAKRISAMLADPVRGPKFHSSLRSGPTAKEERVVIRHNSATNEDTFAAVACYERLVEGAWQHFDANANEIRLPHERTEAPPPPKAGPRR
jgi:hypothetical protein